LTLGQITNILESAAEKGEGSTSGSTIPPFDLFWEFFNGTTPEMNMSRMVKFLEENQALSEQLKTNPWSEASSNKPMIGLSNYYKVNGLESESLAYPPLSYYKMTHTD